MNIKFALFALLSFKFLFSSFQEKPKLSDFKFNYFSQFGEDGIIEKIFEIIEPSSKLCLEVGASDGLICSNTANLWKNKKWTAVLIESDKNKFDQLKKNIVNYDCRAVNLAIGNEVKNSIDFIVSNLNINDVFDIVSIDIDGNDYFIFENLKIKSKLIICEYNPTIPPWLDIYQDYSANSWEFGCSIASLIRIAKEKGYELVALTEVNAFFIDKIYTDKFKNFEISLEKIMFKDQLQAIVTSYNGEPIIVGSGQKWYGLKEDGYNKKLHIKNCSIININKLTVEKTKSSKEELPEKKEF